ncbi:MAG TPA: universal stress protein [Gemmatimonadales bacterium]|nr:universal stress protein [Gemmatimonadales bacterium]
MSWKRVLVGVDESPQAAAAAALGMSLAQALQGECIPVHAVREMWLAFAEEEIVERSAELQAALIAAARRRVEKTLHGHVPEATIRRLMVRPGSPAAVLRDVARDVAADAVVLGGRHHVALRRWTGGSTAHNCVRTIALPVLVVGPRVDGRGTPFHRILSAVDLSEAAASVAAVTRDLAERLGAELRALCVIEPPLPLPDVTSVITPSEYSRLAERTLARRVWPLFRGSEAKTVARQGPVLESIRDEAAAWNADLLVVGSHGKGWGERLILGSATERLLNDLPTSLLVVPVGAPAQTLAPVSRTASRTTGKSARAGSRT